MFSSKTYFLFTILTILPKSRPNMTTTLTDIKFADESLPDGSFKNETDSENEQFQGYIVGGRYAKIQDFPHSAFMVISCYTRQYGYADFTCGASILNQWILLSAAHCFDGCRAGTKILVSVGARKTTLGTYYSVGKFANHGEYDGHVMKNDIAVAILVKPLVFSSTVKRVRLSRVGIYKEPAMLAGWGVTDDKKNTPTQYLKWTRQVVLPKKKCLSLVPQMTRGYFCATADSKQVKSYGYAAVGDSGSALIVRGSIQIGIVSYKVPALSKSLILYTDVTKYHNWIASTAKILYCLD